MSREALELWQRALTALGSSRQLLDSDPDGPSSREYYAAFHAVSALFSLRGATFAKHSAIESAVHRDLVKTGAWSAEIGKTFSFLSRLRRTGDYGSSEHVAPPEAAQAVNGATAILKAVHEAHPDLAPSPR